MQWEKPHSLTSHYILHFVSLAPVKEDIPATSTMLPRLTTLSKRPYSQRRPNPGYLNLPFTNLMDQTCVLSNSPTSREIGGGSGGDSM